MSFIRIIHQNFIYLTDFGLTIMPSEDKRGNIYSTPDGAFGGLIVDRESMPAFLLNDVCCLPVLPLRGDQPVDSFLMSVSFSEVPFMTVFLPAADPDAGRLTETGGSAYLSFSGGFSGHPEIPKRKKTCFGVIFDPAV